MQNADESWSYALPAVPLSALALTFYVFLPKFYTDHFGVGIGTLGVIVLSSRIWDALLDPLIGRLSDETRSKWGRRRPWMFAASLPLAVIVPLVFSPGLRPVWCSSEVWLAFFAFAFFLFWTAVSVPYEALGAELSPDYHLRTGILAKRDGMYLFGTLLAAILPGVFLRIFPGPAEAYSFIGLFYSLLILTAVAICAAKVREPDVFKRAPQTSSGAAAVLKNKPFLILLLAYAISAFGAALPASLLLYYVEDVLHSGRGALFLLLYLFSGCVFLPTWVRLCRVYEKRNTWLFSMLLNSGAFSLVFLLGPGDELPYAALVLISGIGLGATLAIPSSMQADVIDYDEWLSGSRREGLYVGLWSVVKKAAAALGTGGAFLLLDWLGYRAALPGVTSESAVFALRFLYAAVPSICNFLAIAVALSYSLSQAEHQRIRKEIGERANGISWGDHQ